MEWGRNDHYPSLQLNQQALLIYIITRPVLSHDDNEFSIVVGMFWNSFLFPPNDSSWHYYLSIDTNRIIGTTAEKHFSIRVPPYM